MKSSLYHNCRVLWRNRFYKWVIVSEGSIIKYIGPKSRSPVAENNYNLHNSYVMPPFTEILLDIYIDNLEEYIPRLIRGGIGYVGVLLKHPGEKKKLAKLESPIYLFPISVGWDEAYTVLKLKIEDVSHEPKANKIIIDIGLHNKVSEELFSLEELFEKIKRWKKKRMLVYPITTIQSIRKINKFRTAGVDVRPGIYIHNLLMNTKVFGKRRDHGSLLIRSSTHTRLLCKCMKSDSIYLISSGDSPTINLLPYASQLIFRLIDEGRITFFDLIDKYYTNPLKFIGQPNKTEFSQGDSANFIIITYPSQYKIYDRQNVFYDWSMTASIIGMVINGRLLFWEGLRNDT
jgi:hypothetical protein